MYNYLYSFGLMMSKGTGHNLGRGPSKLGPIWYTMKKFLRSSKCKTTNSRRPSDGKSSMESLGKQILAHV
jgi:hypothetical protein